MSESKAFPLFFFPADDAAARFRPGGGNRRQEGSPVFFDREGNIWVRRR